MYNHSLKGVECRRKVISNLTAALKLIYNGIHLFSYSHLSFLLCLLYRCHCLHTVYNKQRTVQKGFTDLHQKKTK